MKSYAELATPKITFMFFFIWGTFAGVMLILGIVIAIFKDMGDSNEAPAEIAMLFIFGSLGISLFIVILAVGSEYAKYRIKVNTLRGYPFTDLEREGYTETIFLKHNRWWFNENAYLKMIKGYPLIINSYRKGYVEMLLLVKNANRIDGLEAGLSVNEAGVVFEVPVNNVTSANLRQREQLISELVDRLQSLSIQPASDVSSYDKYLSRLKWDQAFASFPG